jgi:hypothetical protein
MFFVFTRGVQVAVFTFGIQGLELLSTILRSRGNEFDADVMMRCDVHLLRSRVPHVELRRASSIMMAFGLDNSKKEMEGKCVRLQWFLEIYSVCRVSYNGARSPRSHALTPLFF